MSSALQQVQYIRVHCNAQDYCSALPRYWFALLLQSPRRLVDGAEKDFERRKMGETVGEPARSFLQRPLHFYYQLATSSSSTLSNSGRYSKWIKWGFYPDRMAKIWPMENLKELVDPAQMQWPVQSSLFMDNLSRFYFHLRPSSALKCTKVVGLKTR